MILGRDELVREVTRRQAAGERGVFTNGCFDILHVGHLRTLQAARAQGDFLVIGLNTDASVRRLKGPLRPVVGETERAELLDGLRCVDYVCLFDEPTAGELAAAIRPKVYVKSLEYEGKPLPERAVIEAHGGQVVLVPTHQGFSTTGLIRRIVAAEAGQ